MRRCSVTVAGVCLVVLLAELPPSTPSTASLRPLSPDPALPQNELPSGRGPRADADADSVDDRLEDSLALRFAPIVFHGEDDRSLPVSVDWWLARTHLSVVADSSRGRVINGPLQQQDLLGKSVTTQGTPITSNGTRSRGKSNSFFLETVPESSRSAPVATGEWVTYVHSYPNESGGISLQYWRAYAWNDARFLGINVGHGGDWEAITIHLDPEMRVWRTGYLDHNGIVDWGSAVRWEGAHPLVWSQEGGHASYPDSRHMRSKRWIRQETWTGGAVTRWDGMRLGASGGLRNVGEKSRPREGQVFIQYSGLWGSPGRLFMTSGYWGPAFNETDAQCADGRGAYKSYLRRRAESQDCGAIILRAWCDRMNGARLNRKTECQAARDVF
jgi:hypothetical protein